MRTKPDEEREILEAEDASRGMGVAEAALSHQAEGLMIQGEENLASPCGRGGICAQTQSCCFSRAERERILQDRKCGMEGYLF